MYISTALLLPLTVSAAVIGLEERNSCTDVHLFLARGNGEAYPGRVGAISDTVCSGLPSCDYENIEFVSTQDYCDQAADGASAGIAQIGAYSKRCPNSKLVLAGYSLGAQIVGDILGGGGGSFYGCNERGNAGLSVGAGQVAAVLLFGDVRHVANQGYNVGPGSGDNGQYPRSGGQLSTLNNFSGKIRSYCLSTDPICALGDDGESHTTYMQVYAEAAGQWVQEELGFQSAGPTTAASVPSTTSTEAQSTTSTSTTSGAASSSTSFAPPSDAPTSSSAPSTTSYSSAAASSAAASSSTTTTPANTSTFVPFVFSSTSSGAPTSSFAAPSTTATLPFSVTASSTSSVHSTIATTTTTSSSSAPATSTPAAVTSKGAAGSNAAQLSMTLLTLVVVKVLAF